MKYLTAVVGALLIFVCTLIIFFGIVFSVSRFTRTPISISTTILVLVVALLASFSSFYATFKRYSGRRHGK